MADKEPLENNGDPTPPAPSSSGNDDWKAKYETLKTTHDGVVQNRNMLRNQVSDLTTKNEDMAKKLDNTSAELTKVKTDAETATKKAAANAKQEEILGKASDKTKELVKKLGLELPDAEDADAVKAFEDKVAALNAENPAPTEGQPGETPKAPETPKVGSDNIRLTNDTPPKPGSEEEQLAQEQTRLKDVTF